MSIANDICLSRTDFKFKYQQGKYEGKVRDVYDLGDKLLIITTDRISAFDHILPKPIPYKGQVLNLTAAYHLNKVRDIVPVWLNGTPDPNVAIGWKCEPIKIEMVVRGYLAGHAWRLYNSGQRSICGVAMPDGMKQNQSFDQAIITPTTKAEHGHDEDISLDELRKLKLISDDLLDEMAKISLQLYSRGFEIAAERGLILVDTKYEFGLLNGALCLMDEIHTPDSSRYYIEEHYFDLLYKDQPQIQLSKEFVREWLIVNGFQGLDGQKMPFMPDSFVGHVSNRYIDLYERITGLKFDRPAEGISIESRIRANLSEYLV